jgi:hypothetical protein
MRLALECSAIRSIGLTELSIDAEINRFGARLGNFLILGDDYLIATRR